ncbi:outer membrane protein [Labrys monachus]|uniref:Outer membrane immunogenic protein n=1 Tax=Labrys monachus TaxID=217067 RepID=A0ABU0FBK9_9HYPH|nr:outer membrane protein [Labrys monachus]MDQ0392008.1 outer membrane immunogenic protein [Labrys monachus]
MSKGLFETTAMAVVLSAGAALLFASQPASAADLAPQAVEPAAPVVLPFDWSGPYIGLHAGYGWGREHDDQSSLFSENGPPADHFNMNGFIGGAHAGYNFQFNQFVVGAEGDIDYSALKGDHFYSYDLGTVTGSLKLKSDWQGSARLRAGYAIDNLLLYVTGGVAFADAKLSTAGESSSNTHVGWTAGGGIEYAFTQNWIGRIEVRYSDFEKKSFQTLDGPVKAGWNQTTATAGISYKF